MATSITRSILRVAAPFIALSLLAGCADTRFKADVVRFHSGYQPAAMSVALVPADPALADSLEFTAYANQIGARLGQFGFTPEPDPAKAALIGQISYNSATRRGLREESPVKVGVGVGGVGSHVGVSLGTAFGIGEKTSNDVKVNSLSLRLVKPGGEAVWEGRASSENPAKTGDFATVLPKLIDALFTDFPGPSGRTTRYTEPAGK